MSNLYKGRRSRMVTLVVLFTAILSCFAIGTFARYSAQLFGSGNAQIAKFDVKVEIGETTDFVLNKENSSLEYMFKVKSNSEVAVSYDIIVTLPSALPNEVTLTRDENISVTSNTPTVYTFANAGFLEKGEGENTHKIVVTVNESYAGSGEAFEGVKVEVVASQVEPN